jgi:hypothetical protein
MSAVLPLGPDELLSTTRAVRERLDLSRDVEPELLIHGRTDSAPVVMQASSWGSLLPAAWSFMLVHRDGW